MSKLKCPICSSHLIIDYVTPTKTFEIDEDDKIFRRKNDGIYESKEPYLVFRCEGNVNHDIETQEISKWIDKIEEKFYQEAKYAE